MTSRYTGSGRTKEGGLAAVHHQDFKAHVTGGDFRHDATHVDMNPVIPSLGGATVQETLTNLHTLISSSGSGFISIGDSDGYSSGIYNVNTGSYPTLKEALVAAFADTRLTNGGIILILAGTYVLESSVTVPAGITIIGEVGGTYINSHTVEESMFVIDYGTSNVTIGGDSGSGEVAIESGSNINKVKFYNLILADNLDGYLSDPSMITVPMISVKAGANFEADHVTFLGRLDNGSIANRSKTFSAISTIAGTASGTSIKVSNCFIDGVKIGVKLNSQLGQLDYLSVLNSKIRTYGTEGASTVSENCCVFSSLCNLDISGNYYIGAGTVTNTFLNIGTTGGSTDNIKVKVIGNTGKGTSATAELVDNDSAVTFSSVITGNNWGKSVNSPWYLVVGGADGNSPLGDLYGPNAIDKLLQLTSSSAIDATVIVNPGTYTVTGTGTGSTNWGNIKLIGNKRGVSYPEFQLNLTSPTTDVLGNPVLSLSSYIESIKFTATSVHSVRAAHATFNNSESSITGSGNIRIKDCVFDNVTLNIKDSSSMSLETSVIIEDCYFTDNDTIALIGPRYNQFIIRNCIFNDCSYAIDLGTTYGDGVTAIHLPSYTLENVLFDMCDKTVTATPPVITGDDTDSFVRIVDTSADVNFINVKSIVNTTYTTATQTFSTSLSSVFLSFIKVNARTFDMYNCFFNGPTGYKTISAVNYLLPCLLLDLTYGCRILGSKILSGGLPLQITGISETTNPDCVIIDNCEFINIASDCLGVLDIDIDKSSTAVPTDIKISNCTFSSESTTASRDVYHFEVYSPTSYDGAGLVQIYAKNFHINFSNSKIFGQLNNPTSALFNNLAGLIINNYISDGGSIAIGHANSINVNNSSVMITANDFATATATDSASCLWTRGFNTNINNNFFLLNNDATPSTSFIGCLYTKCEGTTAKGQIIGNTFNRDATNFANGFVKLGGSARGIMVDNVFSHTTVDIAATNEVIINQDEISTDKNHPDRWYVKRNINQVETAFIRFSDGLCSNDPSGTNTSMSLMGSFAVDPTLEVNIDPRAGDGDLGLTLLASSASGAGFNWVCNLYNALPHGVKILNVEGFGSRTAAFDNGTFTLYLTSDLATDLNSSINFNSTSSATLTLTPGNTGTTDTFLNNYEDGLKLQLISTNITDASANAQFRTIEVKYCW